MQEETDKSDHQEEVPVLLPPPPFVVFTFKSHRAPVLILWLLSILFYWRTLKNEYALDDGIAIQQNEYVLKGFAGIPSIFTHDYYDSFYRRMNANPQLSGGRYRPLTALTFAAEQQIMGPYRTGYYQMAYDLNGNGVMDRQPVPAPAANGHTVLRYEYNDAVDLNNDKVITPEECFDCWDLNRNFRNDPQEDLNTDGVFNEVDCQVYQAGWRHLVNVLLFMLCCVCLYLFFAKQFMPDRPDLAFLAALLFSIHPVLSESVANVKGREDLLSLLFIILSLHYALRYTKIQKWTSLFISMLCALLALLSKEYAMALLVLLPLTLYMRNVEFRRKSLLLSAAIFLILLTMMTLANLGILPPGTSPLLIYVVATLAFAVSCISIRRLLNSSSAILMAGVFQVFLIYSALRLNAVVLEAKVPETEILNNPFLLADGAEKFATKFYVLLHYLKLVFYPHPLISDYSYDTIPIQGLLSPWFLLSLLIHAGLLVLGIAGLRKKQLWGYGILVYLLFILMGSNLIFDTHIIMLESYLFHAMFGACLTIAWVLLSAVNAVRGQEVKSQRLVLYPVLLLLIVFGGIKAWERSADWKNDVTLFLKDVENAPNSVLVLGNAGARWVDLADTREITGTIMEGQENIPFNDYNGLLRIEEEEWKKAGYAGAREAALYRGIGYLRHAVDLHPRYVNGYLNLGLAYYKLAKDDSTLLFWKMAEFLYPTNPYLQNYYSVYRHQLLSRAAAHFDKTEYNEAALAYKRALIIKKNDTDALMGLVGVRYNEGKREEAKRILARVLEKEPGNTEALRLMKFFDMP
jgi:tetratricopeptide (TPR) repeat protein